MTENESEKRIRKILQHNDSEKLDELIPFVYEELKKLAAFYFRSERKNHTLQPTALVHELYIRLVTENKHFSWESRAHFLGIAARVMRQILVNYAHAYRSQKRHGGQTLIVLDESIDYSYHPNIDIINLNEALERLARLDKVQAQIIELRFFGGLSMEETAAILGISTATVSRNWLMAKTWLYRELKND